jgi:hypothetical protein
MTCGGGQVAYVLRGHNVPRKRLCPFWHGAEAPTVQVVKDDDLHLHAHDPVRHAAIVQQTSSISEGHITKLYRHLTGWSRKSCQE